MMKRLPDRSRFLGYTLAICLCSICIGCASPSPKAELAYFPPPPAVPHAVHLISFNRLHDLVPATVRWTDTFRGAPVSPHVVTPAGISFAGESLYICDTQLNTVHVWNLTDGGARFLGRGGESPLVEPVDVAVDEDGVVFVADAGQDKILVYDADGHLRSEWLPPTESLPWHPVGVGLGRDTLFVADAENHQIHEFAVTSGEYIGSFGSPGAKPGEMFFPMDACTDKEENILVADMFNSRVQQFDTKQNLMLAMGGPGNRYGDMGKPKRLARGPDGVIFIADPGFAHVHLYNNQGQLLMLLGGNDSSTGATPMPSGVAAARTLPARLTDLVPANFKAHYFLFISNTVGPKHVSLYAIGLGQ